MERILAPVVAALYRRLSTDDTVWTATAAPGPPDPDPRWWTGTALATGPGYAAAFAQTAQDLAVRTGRQPRPYVVDTLLLMEYSWCVAAALVGPVLSAGTLVDVAPGGVAAWFAADETATPCWRVHVTAEGVRPADPRHPATLAGIRDRHVALIGPVVDAAARHGRRRGSSLWRAATDTLATACWSVGAHLGDEPAGVALADALLGDDAPAPLRGRAGFRRLVLSDGTGVTTRERGDCCFYYTLDQPACVTCPRLDDAARAARLSERLVTTPA